MTDDEDDEDDEDAAKEPEPTGNPTTTWTVK